MSFTVEGGWSQWSPWTQCSRSCGNGTISRARWCSSPERGFGGESCAIGEHTVMMGIDVEEEPCLVRMCPSKSVAWWRHEIETFFRVTGALCGEYTGYRWIPLTKASGAELWCFFDLRQKKKRLSTHSWGWWFETPSRSSWRHCNVLLAFSEREPPMTGVVSHKGPVMRGCGVCFAVRSKNCWTKSRNAVMISHVMMITTKTMVIMTLMMTMTSAMIITENRKLSLIWSSLATP